MQQQMYFEVHRQQDLHLGVEEAWKPDAVGGHDAASCPGGKLVIALQDVLVPGRQGVHLLEPR